MFCSETEGRVYHSLVDEKQKAQKAYDTAKKQGQTAGQVKQMWASEQLHQGTEKALEVLCNMWTLALN